MKKRTVFLCFASLLFIQLTAFAQKPAAYHVAKTFKINGDGKWDYIAQNPINGNIYVAHGVRVNIIDKNSGATIDSISNTQGVHGIAFVPSVSKGFTSNGKANNLSVFDIHTNKILGTITTGESPDAMIYDAFSKKLFVCNGHSKSISVIDPTTDQVVTTIQVSGKPETIVTDDEGKLYVNIEDKNEITVIDAKTMSPAAHWSLGKGTEPTGLAIDKKNKRLFAGCGNKMLVIVNMQNGHLIDYVAIGDDCDGVAFDAKLNHIYTSNGEGTLTIIKEKSANEFIVLEHLKTQKGARTLAVDESTHLVYLPVAEMASGSEGKKTAIIHNTFSVLCIGH
jgi:YVTN family beta-propeller protein